MYKIKRLFSVILITVIVLMGIPAGAESISPTIKIENEVVVFPDAQPKIISNTTMLPIRIVAEKLGLKVTWESKTKTVLISKDHSQISLSIGSKWVQKDGNKAMLSVAPYIENERTMVPIRFISEAMGYHVGWSGEYRSAVISRKPIEAFMYRVEKVKNYTDEDLYWLSRVIHAEMGSSWMPDWVQRATGSVVLNRVKSSKYANSIKEVLWQPGQYGCVSNGSIYMNPSQRSIDNARYILENGSVLPDTVMSQDLRIWGPVYTSYYDSVLGVTVYFCHIY